MKRSRLFFLVAAITMAAASAAAQLAPPLPNSSLPGGTFVVGFGPFGNGLSTKRNAPFSTVIVEQTQQTLNDGTNISREYEETVMRDSRGRIYRARKIIRPQHIGPVPNAAPVPEHPPMMIITITDPVRHVQYFCSPVRICRKSAYRQPPTLRRPFANDRKKMPDVTVDDLGPSTVSGIEVRGARITRVVPEGSAGNDRPFTTSEEVWYSKALDADVEVKRTDPRMGTRTTTMTEVSLREPDPSYFQVPAGYRVEDRAAASDRPVAPMPPGNGTWYSPGIAPPNQ